LKAWVIWFAATRAENRSLWASLSRRPGTVAPRRIGDLKSQERRV